MRLIPKIGASKKDTKRRSPATRRPRQLTTLGVGAASIAAIGVGAWQLSANGWVDARIARVSASALEMSANAGLRVGNVFLSGRKNANATEILAALDVERGSPLLPGKHMSGRHTPPLA